MRRLSVGLTVLVASSCGASDGDSRYSDADVEYRLAVVAEGGGVSDADVDRYAEALDRAEPLCEQDRERIADMAVAGAQSANPPGSVTMLELVEGISASVPAEMAPTDCAQIVAAIVVLAGG